MIDSTEAGLLHAIAVNHADNTPRLVYADWVEEHGEAPRAEFIRVQCERATADTPALRLRERELLDKHRRAWCDSYGVPLEDVGFERGLISRFRPKQWEGGKFLDPLFLPRLLTVSELDLSGLKLDNRDVFDLTLAELPALRKLMLNDNAISDPGAAVLAAAKHLPLLDTLYLFGNAIENPEPLRKRFANVDLGETAEGYSLSRGQAETARRIMLRTQIVPFVETYFAKYPRLQSAMLCVAQYWNDEADDAVHGQIIVSELPEPVLVDHSFDDESAKKDPNVPRTKIKGEYGERGSVIGLWGKVRWHDNTDAIPVWAAFSPEGGSQEGDPTDSYAPAVIFYRHGGYDMLPMQRPHLDGVRAEWDAMEDED